MIAILLPDGTVETTTDGDHLNLFSRLFEEGKITEANAAELVFGELTPDDEFIDGKERRP